MPEFDLAALGWTPELAEKLEPGLVPGRVVAAHRAAYDVQTADGPVRTRLPGRLVHENARRRGRRLGRPRRRADPRGAAAAERDRAPGGGPDVRAQTLAANVDIAFVVTSLGPELEPRRIERYLVTIWESGAVAGGRADEGRSARGSVGAGRRGRGRCDGRAGARRQRADRPGLRRVACAAAPGVTAVLLGSSGVGKSTLVNRFVGQRADGGEGDARRRRRGPAHDGASRADRAAGRRRRDRHARAFASSSCGTAAGSTRRSRTSRRSRRRAASTTARTRPSPAAR